MKEWFKPIGITSDYQHTFYMPKLEVKAILDYVINTNTRKIGLKHGSTYLTIVIL